MSLKSRVEAATVLWLIVASAVSAGGQSGRLRGKAKPAQRHDDKDAIRLRVEEVLLPVSVHSDLGKLPPNLQRSDFILTEDGKKKVINSVSHSPANVLFVVDAGGDSTLKNLSINRELALKIVDSLSDQDRAAVVSYSDGASLLSDWTGDKGALRRGLEWKLRPGIKSDFYRTLMYSAHEVLPKVSGRRSVVIMSDGVDSFDEIDFEDVLKEFHRVRATVYIVTQNQMLVKELKSRTSNPLSSFEMLDPVVRRRIEKLRAYSRQLEAAEFTLKGLAEETGGAVWNPRTKEEFAALKSDIVTEIGAEYLFAYSTERERDDTKFHAIGVYATRPGLQVRSRRGIYATVVERKESVLSDRPRGAVALRRTSEKASRRAVL